MWLKTVNVSINTVQKKTKKNVGLLVCHRLDKVRKITCVKRDIALYVRMNYVDVILFTIQILYL